MRAGALALLALFGGWVVLVFAKHALARSGPQCAPGHCAGVNFSSGSYATGLGGGTCQSAGGDFSLSIPDKSLYFHLLRTAKSHGNYRTVAWHVWRHGDGVMFGVQIVIGKDADGRTTGTFSGRTTKGALTQGSFSCG